MKKDTVYEREFPRPVTLTDLYNIFSYNTIVFISRQGYSFETNQVSHQIKIFSNVY